LHDDPPISEEADGILCFPSGGSSEGIEDIIYISNFQAFEEL